MINRPLIAVCVTAALPFFTFALAGEQNPAAGTQQTPPAEPVVHEKLKSFVPVTEDMLLNPRPENWISYRNGYKAWGYSSLNQINSGNVGQLRLAWSRAMQDGPQEVEPIVYNGIMFLANADDVIQALDATTGDQLWEYRRKLPTDVRPVTGTMGRYRNIAIFDDKLYLASQDMFLVALDARTGREVWTTKRGDYKDKISSTAGPVIVKGKAITGTRCDPSSPLVGGCYVTANDVRHGEEAWRMYVAAKPGEPGGDTWADVPLEQRRSSSPWMVGSYDPALNLFFMGTGVAQNLRPENAKDGALLYTNSTVAVDPDTGKMVWYYQHLPNDTRDLDHAFERMIVETSLAPSSEEVPWINPRIKPGEKRKVITGIPGKTGIVWANDAKTGEFLWARPTTLQTVMTGVDGDTGKVILNEPYPLPYTCPFLYGGKNQPSGAYNPSTNAMYMPLNNVCNGVAHGNGPAPRGATHIPGVDPATAPVGRLEAISASTGKTLWKYQQRAPVYGSLLTTGGNLVFGGDTVRRFRAFAADSGKVLWEIILNGPVGARPMTYSVGGKQYLAIGAGGNSQGTSYLSLTPELNTTRGGGNTMFVFALP